MIDIKRAIALALSLVCLSSSFLSIMIKYLLNKISIAQHRGAK